MKLRRGCLGIAAAMLLALPAAPARAATPTVTEFTTGIETPAFLYGITAGSDGKVWYANKLQDKLGAITVSSGAINELVVGSSPVGVTNGPDGNLYYALGNDPSFSNHVGAINPVTGEFGLTWYGGGNPALPHYPITGPDGRIWVTEPGPTTGDDKVGIVESDPNLTPGPPVNTGPSIIGEVDFSVGDNQEPEQIIAGPGVSAGTPNPSLWATEFNGNRIARLRPVGLGGGGIGAIVDEYVLPTGGANPKGITLGPDGNIWFTEWTANKVGRLTPPTTLNGAPTIVEFPLPGVNPAGIAAGADGNLWIAAVSSGEIIRMNTAGVVTGEFPTGDGGPHFITAAPDGNLWYTLFTGDAVGRITTALDPPAFRNEAPIDILLIGTTNPAPSVDVSGLQGTVTDVTVRLTGISHTFPDDLDILLEGPQGQTVMLASDAGSAVGSRTTGTKESHPADGITLNFSDSAPRRLSDLDPLVSGFYKPTNINDPAEAPPELAAPAPLTDLQTPFSTSLSTFDGTTPNGTWKLWVGDDDQDALDRAGKVFGGWGLDITTTGPPQQKPPGVTKKKCKKGKKGKGGPAAAAKTKKKKCKKKRRKQPG